MVYKLANIGLGICREKWKEIVILPWSLWYFSADSRLAPSQWETSLQSKTVSHWLGANLESALYLWHDYVMHGCSVELPSLSVLCQKQVLTHWGRVTHICVGKLTIIGSDNGLSPGRRQAIIWTNAGIFLIGPLGTNFSEILTEIHAFSFKKIHLKMSSAKWRPFCFGLNVLKEGTSIYFPHILWGVITYPCPWYHLLAQHSSFVI